MATMASQPSRIDTAAGSLLPDPFVLITRSPTSGLTASPLVGAQLGPPARWRLRRAYPLGLLALLDAAITTYTLVHARHRALPEAAAGQLRDVVLVGYVRALLVLVMALRITWRRKAAWILSTTIGTACLVAWEVDWLVLSRHEEAVGRGSFWVATLASQLGVGVLEYILFNVLLYHSPLAAHDPTEATPATIPRFGPGRRAAMTRRQRAVSHRYREESLHDHLDGLLDGGAGAMPVYGSLDEASRASRAGSTGRRGSVTFAPESQGAREYLAPHHEDGAGHAHDDDADSLSIGRYSDEGDSSSSSISSNEIVDLPPPRSPGQLRTLHSTSSLGFEEGLRLRNEAWPRGAGRHRRNQHSLSMGGWRADLVQDEAPPLGPGAGRLDLDDEDGERPPSQASAGMDPRPEEDRLERGLCKRWARMSRRLWTRRRSAA